MPNKPRQRAICLKKKVGGWVEMNFDRELRFEGVRWLRVKGGMGGRGDREDWVADVELTVSVHDYQWREPRWGSDSYKSMTEAMTAQLRRGLERLEKKARDLEKQLASVKRSLRRSTLLIKKKALHP